jgi:hypothetical protein
MSFVRGVSIEPSPKMSPQDPGSAHIDRHCGSEKYLTGHRQTAFSDSQCLEKCTKTGSWGNYFSTKHSGHPP